jgi:ligand-binding sensor domain-containing protein
LTPFSRKQITATAFALCISAFVFYAGWALTRARDSVTLATAQVKNDHQFQFRTVVLDRPVPAGFEPISSSSQLSDAVLFHGQLYICGPSGLLAFDLHGTLIAQYRPGMELPSAPLVRMATAALSDSLGPQLWIATGGEGLLQFDGRTFRQIRPDDAGARALTSVLPLTTGRVLLGSETSGVLAWDGQSLTPLHPALSGEHITALAGSEADLWVGTIDHGLLHWYAGQLDRFTEGSGLPDPRVLSLAIAGQRVFAGTPLGIAEFQDGRFTRVLAAGTFANTLLAHDETLSVGTLEKGVIDVPITAERARPRNPDASTELGSVERLLRFEDHTYALTGTGLYERSPKAVGWISVLDLPGSRLTDRNISALNVDRSGNLWVGYFDRGLDILHPGLDRKTHFEDEHVFCVNRIAMDDDNSVTAVGTANGLVLFDASQHQRRVMTKADGLIASNVSDVILRPGAMSVATPAGITTVGQSETTSLYAFHGLVNNHVYALAASGSRLLAGTLGGLSMLDSGVVTASYTTGNSGLKHNWITSIVGVDNDWFLGTYGAGVLKLDSIGRWTSFPDLKGALVINPNAMTVTARAVYAGTLGKGLAVYNRASDRWVRITTGLPSLNVTALATAQGYIYLGTDNGLVRIQESQVGLQ